MRLFLDVRVPYDVFRMYINPLYENNIDWIIVRNYFVHSANPVGEKNIESYLENFKKHSI